MPTINLSNLDVLRFLSSSLVLIDPPLLSFVQCQIEMLELEKAEVENFAGGTQYTLGTIPYKMTKLIT